MALSSEVLVSRGVEANSRVPWDWDLDWPDKQKFYSLQPLTNSLKNGGPGRRHERS